MKKLKFLFFHILVLNAFLTNSQTPLPTGARLPNATEVTTATRVPVMDENGIVNYYISPSNLTGVNINQDNIYRNINVQSIDFDLSNIASAINNLPSFTVNDIDIFFFRISEINNIEAGYVVATLKDVGKGNYGSGGTVLTDQNINVISTLPFSILDIEQEASTQFIDLGDIGAASIEDGFNAHTFSGAEDPVQNQEDGYVIVNTIQNGNPTQYLFVGQGGDYGVGGVDTAVNEDFTLVEVFQSDDVWRDRDGILPATSYSQWIRHQGDVNFDGDIYVNGEVNSGYNSFSKLTISGNYGAEFRAGNKNIGNYIFDTGAPTGLYLTSRGYYNIILRRTYSFVSGTGPVGTFSLTIDPTIDFSNTASGNHHSIYNNPNIIDLNGGNNYFLYSNVGDVFIDNSEITLASYGQGNIVGTPVYNAAFDANGKIVETSLGAGGGTDDQTAAEVSSDDATYDVITGTTVQANLISADNAIYSTTPQEVNDTGTEIFLTTSGGIISNFGSANTNTTFTEGAGAVLNGWNQILINTVSEPVVPVSWTQVGGIEWRTGNLHMVVRNTGSQGVIYYYLPLEVGVSNGNSGYGERLTDLSVSGAFNLDWALYNAFDLTLSGGTTLSDINLPNSTQTKDIILKITGNQLLTLPATWTAMPNNDLYDGTGDNLIVVSCINGNSGSEMIVYTLTNF